MTRSIVHIPSGEGRKIWFGGDMFTYLMTGDESGGTLFTLISRVSPGNGAPPHLHLYEEEQFYVMDGEFTFWVGDQTIHATAGDFICVPRQTVHSFRNERDTSGNLFITFSPAGIEALFMTLGIPVDDPAGPPPTVPEEIIAKIPALNEKYGVRPGPSPTGSH